MSAPTELPAYLYASRTPNIIAAVSVLWVIGTAGVALRLWARRVAALKLGPDDWFALLAWVPFTATIAANYVACYLGAGRHIAVVIQEKPWIVGPYLKYVFIVEFMYPWIIGPVKWSILSLFIRIFGVNKKFKMYCYFLMGLSFAWFLSIEFGTLFQCYPVAEAWNPMGDRSQCIDLATLLVGLNVPSIVIDALILTAPLRLVWQLKVPTRRKFFISGILLLGCCETAFSIVRLVLFVRLRTTDPLWDYFDALVWSTVLEAIAILCVCLPVIGPLMPAWFMGVGQSDQHYTSEHTTGDSRSKRSSKFKNSTPRGMFSLRSLGNDDDFVELDDHSSVEDSRQPKHEGIQRTTEVIVEHERNIAHVGP